MSTEQADQQARIAALVSETITAIKNREFDAILKGEVEA